MANMADMADIANMAKPKLDILESLCIDLRTWCPVKIDYHAKFQLFLSISEHFRAFQAFWSISGEMALKCSEMLRNAQKELKFGMVVYFHQAPSSKF